MKNVHKGFIIGVLILGIILRLYPRIQIDPHLLTFQGDIWYRLAMAQYILDNGALPDPDLRYLAYGEVPMWYPPLSPLFLAAISYVSGLDLPTVSSRIIPFLEAASPLSIFLLAKYMYDDNAAYISTLTLALTPTFVFWTAISDPQSFTLFLIPLYILLWLRHVEDPKKSNLVLLGAALAINFIVHLSFFVSALVLFFATTAIVAKKQAGLWLYRDLSIALLLSQILTIPWWLPKNLYWWWIKALVTSSGLYSAVWQIGDYGIVAFSLGTFSFAAIFLSLKFDYLKEVVGNKWSLLLILWAFPLFLESQNEAILFALNRPELTWKTLAKPLEGFRFFPYLAQPAAIATGAFFSGMIRSVKVKRSYIPIINVATIGLIGGLLIWGLVVPYKLDVKLQTSGLTVKEYDAAIWYKSKSAEDSRIAADYYRAQMLSGVTGGKALDGGMFPLRNVDLPHISVPATVQDDLYILYNTKDPKEASDLAKRYGITHVFYSRNMENYGNLLSSYRPASQYGVPISMEKFEDAQFFRKVYEDDLGGVIIFEVL